MSNTFKNIWISIFGFVLVAPIHTTLWGQYKPKVKIKTYGLEKSTKRNPVVAWVDFSDQNYVYGTVYHRKKKALLAVPLSKKNFKPANHEEEIVNGKKIDVDGFKVLLAHKKWANYKMLGRKTIAWQGGTMMIMPGRGPSKDYGKVGVFIDSTLSPDPPMVLASMDLHGLYYPTIVKYVPDDFIKDQNNFLAIEFASKRWLKPRKHYEFTIIDSSLQIVQQNSFEETDLAKEIRIQDRVITKNGEYILVAKVFNRKKGEKKNKVATWPYQLVVFRPGISKPEKINYDFGERYLGAMKLVEYQGKMAVAGIYGKTKKTFDGLLFAVLDPQTFEIQEQITKSFQAIVLEASDEEDSEEVAPEDPAQSKSNKKGSKVQGDNRGLTKRRIENPKIPVTRIIENPDGSAYVVAEEQWETTSCNSKGECYTNYFSGRLLVIYLTETGEPSWVRVITKIGSEQYPEGSYTYFDVSKGPMLMFEEQSEAPSEVEYNTRELRRKSVFAKGKVSAVVLNPEGNLSKFEVVNNHRQKTYISPKNISQATDNPDLFYFTNFQKKKIGLGTLELKF